jgi:outer membrane immunogenic protein
MKKILLSVAALVATCGGAMAADLAARPYTKAPAMIAPVYSWTGCYIGGNVGYGWSQTKWETNALEFTSHHVDGVAGGGQIGCDYQSGPWVFGIQGMFDAADMKGSGVNRFLDPGGRVIDASKFSWLATLTGRLGYTVQPTTLLYVKGGAAWARANFKECCEPTVFLADTIGFLADGIADRTRSGWTVGAGLEHMFAPNWSAFIEYDYIGLGRQTVTFSPINGSPGPFNYRIDQNIHTVLAGINYRFGWGGLVVAKY